MNANNDADDDAFQIECDLLKVAVTYANVVSRTQLNNLDALVYMCAKIVHSLYLWSRLNLSLKSLSKWEQTQHTGFWNLLKVSVSICKVFKWRPLLAPITSEELFRRFDSSIELFTRNNLPPFAASQVCRPADGSVLK